MKNYRKRLLTKNAIVHWPQAAQKRIEIVYNQQPLTIIHSTLPVKFLHNRKENSLQSTQRERDSFDLLGVLCGLCG